MPAKIEITKAIQGSGAPTDEEFEFEVTYVPYGATEATTETFKLKGGETATIENVEPDTEYTVVEKLTEEQTKTWTLTAEQNTAGTTAEGRTSTASFLNTYEPLVGDLVVTKTAKGGDGTESFNFTVTLSDTTINGTYGEMAFVNGVATFTLKDGESKTAIGLPEGVTYVVTEEETKGWTTESRGAEGVIADGIAARAEFTNTFVPDPAEIKVTKTVVGTGAPKDAEFEFEITYVPFGQKEAVKETFKLKAGETKSFKAARGTEYTVEEKLTEEQAKNWKADEAKQTGKVGEVAESITVAFKNTYTAPKTGNLTVTKTITGSGLTADDRATQFTFTVTLSDKTINGTFGDMVFTNGVATFTLKGGESKTANGLPEGVTYTVTETAPSGWKQTAANGATGTIKSGATARASFTNTKDTTTPPSTTPPTTITTSTPKTVTTTSGSTPTPKTGDPSNLAAPIALIGLGGAGVAAAAWMRRKRDEEEGEGTEEK